MPYKPAQLPHELKLDATIPEVMAFRRESQRKVYAKLKAGLYRSHKNGGTRLIVWSSVLEDRERDLAKGVQLPAPPPPTEKRKPGRPKKLRPEAQPPAAE